MSKIKPTLLIVAALYVSSVYAMHHSAKKIIYARADTSGCDCDVDKQIALAGKSKGNKKLINSASISKNKTDATIPKYLDPKVPIEERISDLLPRLTLEEKVIELSDSWGSKAIPRLKIPAMLKTEGLHGQSYSTGATIYPQPIAMASTFNTDLINKVGIATAVESKAANLRVTWSPVLDVARDARWGRVEETYGEDPYLVSRMGVAWINGFQSLGMLAVPKHFAGHGEPLGGRDSHDVGLSDRVMRNVHLVPFRAAVEEAHVGGVMAAYSTWNAVPDNGSTELLQKILREEWGFDGMVVSDCSGPENFLYKQSTVSNLEEACREAIRAGVDIECGSAFKKALKQAVQDGYLKESELDNNLRRVLRAKFKLGLFENAGSPDMVWDKLPAYNTPEYQALAREVAVQGSVLLKNDHQLLPLKKTIKTIAVIGPNADIAQIGDYSAKPENGQLVTVLQGIKSHVSTGTKVLYAHGCDVLSADTSGFAEAKQMAAQADAVVLVVGDQSVRENIHDASKPTTGENVDGATLEIPGVQLRLIKAIQATGKPVVLVLVNGKPFTLSWEAENIPAILETWYPGEEGGNATADLIFGDRNPSGKLPMTFPRHVGQLPLTYDYMPSGRNYNYYDMPFAPLFRFGYGLSYTTFKYSNLVITPKKDDPGFVSVSVDIQNTGNRDGDEAVQLYVTDMVTSVITPVIQLKGVKKMSLKKGETQTVRFELTPYQLSILNPNMDRVLESGKFRVHVGSASPEFPGGNTDQKQKIGFSNPNEGVSGEFEVGKNYEANFSYHLKAPATVHAGESFPVTVTAKNDGNLLDIADLKIYGESLIDTHRFEIEQGQTKSYTFNITLYHSGQQNVNVVLGSKIIAGSIQVLKSPARLQLTNAHTVIGNDGILHYKALATNIGSEPYQNVLTIAADGKEVAHQSLTLASGEHRDVNIDYSFPHSGAFQLKIGSDAPQQIVVPGGVSLGLKDPLVYLNFDTATDGGVRNEVTGNLLQVKGKPVYANGKQGKGFYTANKSTFISAGSLDLYRKPFTLATWVNIDALYDGQAMLFGGQAPMGADIDVSGTNLAAGIVNQHLLASFQDRDVKGKSPIETGKWVHVAYTYNPDREQGSLYINGKLDQVGAQKPYAGPLEIIGGAQRFNHGKYTMDDVLITRSCLSESSIKLLADQGIKAFQQGELTTDWRDLATMPANLRTSANIPSNSKITVTVDVGDKNGGSIDTKTFELKSGEQNIPLGGIKAGGKVRLKISFTAAKLGIMPVLQTVSLDNIRWSTTDEWQKGACSESLKIGL